MPRRRKAGETGCWRSMVRLIPVYCRALCPPERPEGAGAGGKTLVPGKVGCFLRPCRALCPAGWLDGVGTGRCTLGTADIRIAVRYAPTTQGWRDRVLASAVRLIPVCCRALCPPERLEGVERRTYQGRTGAFSDPAVRYAPTQGWKGWVLANARSGRLISFAGTARFSVLACAGPPLEGRGLVTPAEKRTY